MRLLKSFLSRRLATLIPTKSVLRRSPIGVISFTFDDFPRSAFTIGGKILNHYAVAGTYYVAGRLTGTEENGVPCHTAADIKSAVDSGHEIGTHGYAHIRYSELTAKQIDEDLEKNKEFLVDILNDTPPVSFSYPFGVCELKTKRQLAPRFNTLRGISRGINGDLSDLSNLRANSIYSYKTTEQKIQQLIEQTTAMKGWLIFYTHDVSDAPTVWGTTPALLEFAVREAVTSGCCVLPVRDALGIEPSSDTLSI